MINYYLFITIRLIERCAITYNFNDDDKKEKTQKKILLNSEISVIL